MMALAAKMQMDDNVPSRWRSACASYSRRLALTRGAGRPGTAAAGPGPPAAALSRSRQVPDPDPLRRHGTAARLAPHAVRAVPLGEALRGPGYPGEQVRPPGRELAQPGHRDLMPGPGELPPLR